MDQRVLKEAVDWYVRMHEGPPSAPTRTQFTDWLLTSPEHIQAFLNITRSIESLSDASRGYDREKLISAAAASREPSNVIPLDGVPNVLPNERRRTDGSSSNIARRLTSWLVAVIVGGSLGAGALCGWLACDHWHHTRSDTSLSSG